MIPAQLVEQYMQQARMLAAQCWCDEETSGKEMDATLAEAVARRIALWMDKAAQMARNADYYRDLLDECAKLLGVAAYTSNDGTAQDEPLRLKVPELVAALQKQLAAAKEDAECAWRNVRILEAARVEEMRKRDARTELLRRTLPMLSGAGAGILAAEICECIAMHPSMASVRTTNSVGRTLESGSGHL